MPATKKETRQERDSQLVQMRLSPKTMDHVKHLKKLTGISNRTQLVASAIQLTDILRSKTEAGGRLCVENPDGTKDYITVVGL